MSLETLGEFATEHLAWIHDTERVIAKRRLTDHEVLTLRDLTHNSIVGNDRCGASLKGTR